MLPHCTSFWWRGSAAACLETCSASHVWVHHRLDDLGQNNSSKSKTSDQRTSLEKASWLEVHSKAGDFTYHMHSISKDKRPFQARFVRHHDHRAPLHAAASLPTFKTPFHKKLKILRLQSCDFNSEGIQPSAQDVTVTCWMRMLCAAFKCSRKPWDAEDERAGMMLSHS